MRERITGRVAPFPLARIFEDALAVHAHAVGNRVAGNATFALERKRKHARLETVAFVLVIFSHTEFAAHGSTRAVGTTGLIEPILAVDVVADEFVGLIARSQERERVVFIRIEAERKRSEESLETVLFEAVEVDLERLGIGTCAETRFARFRGEAIVVDGNIAQERNFPLFVWGKVDESLIIEVFRVVFALAFERAEQTRVSLETEAVKLTELFAALTHR